MTLLYWSSIHLFTNFSNFKILAFGILFSSTQYSIIQWELSSNCLVSMQTNNSLIRKIARQTSKGDRLYWRILTLVTMNLQEINTGKVLCSVRKENKAENGQFCKKSYIYVNSFSLLDSVVLVKPTKWKVSLIFPTNQMWLKNL
jgi:hypothetical protein